MRGSVTLVLWVGMTALGAAMAERLGSGEWMVITFALLAGGAGAGVRDLALRHREARQQERADAERRAIGQAFDVEELLGREAADLFRDAGKRPDPRCIGQAMAGAE